MQRVTMYLFRVFFAEQTISTLLISLSKEFQVPTNPNEALHTISRIVDQSHGIENVKNFVLEQLPQPVPPSSSHPSE